MSTGDFDRDAEQASELLPRCALILGKGRSGTTWLAQILNTYEHASYKHEPFLAGKQTVYNGWCRDLEARDTESLRREFASICGRAVHGVDQPPFPAKAFRSQSPQILHLLYGLGKRVPALKYLYEWYGRPRLDSRTWILLKEVNFPNERLARLCEVLRPALIPIVRSPFANIASHLKGVEMGIFSTRTDRDVARVRELIDSPGGDAWAEYRDQLEGMSIAAFEALRWRIQCEPLVAITHESGPCHLVIYEDLCADPLGQTTRLFEFLGWELGEPTRAFLDASVAGERRNRSSRQSYFSVYRNPVESADKWKAQLSATHCSDIRSVLRGSPLAKFWPDLAEPEAEST